MWWNKESTGHHYLESTRCCSHNYLAAAVFGTHENILVFLTMTPGLVNRWKHQLLCSRFGSRRLTCSNRISGQMNGWYWCHIRIPPRAQTPRKQTCHVPTVELVTTAETRSSNMHRSEKSMIQAANAGWTLFNICSGPLHIFIIVRHLTQAWPFVNAPFHKKPWHLNMPRTKQDLFSQKWQTVLRARVPGLTGLGEWWAASHCKPFVSWALYPHSPKLKGGSLCLGSQRCGCIRSQSMVDCVALTNRVRLFLTHRYVRDGRLSNAPASKEVNLL